MRFMRLGLIIGLLLTLVGIVFITFSDVKTRSMYDVYCDATVQIKLADGGWGSGVVVVDNVILTAKHVIEGITEATIVMSNGTLYRATKFITDSNNDMGIILVDMLELAILPISEMRLERGLDVVVVGCPLDIGLEWNTSTGIITNVRRDIWLWTDVFVVDAFGAPGYSGGPVICDGKVIGVMVGGPDRDGSCLGICEPVTNLDREIRSCLRN